jgi:hypothetical protein
MGQPLTIQVDWDASSKGPTAANATVSNDGATTIQWVPAAGSGITAINITGLDSTMFTGFSGQGTTSVSCTDENTNPRNQDYNYTITVTHSSGARRSHDPKISNGGRGSTVSPSMTRKPEVQL